jgi:hypothetical protein
MPYVGFLVVMLTGAGLIVLVQSVANDPVFVALLAQHSQWAAAHAQTLGFVAAGIVFVITAMIPWRLMHSDDGEEKLAMLGLLGGAVAQVCFLICLLPAAGYLIGLGWFAAQHAAIK